MLRRLSSARSSSLNSSKWRHVASTFCCLGVIIASASTGLPTAESKRKRKNKPRAAVVHVEGSGDRVDSRINALEAALLNAVQDLEDNGIRGPGAQTSASTPSPRLEHGIGDPPWMLPTWGGPTSTENAKALP